MYASNLKRYKLLALIPLFTYLLSYLYLAFYHQSFALITLPIHESGKYNFLEVMFYASHFIGHIPVHTVLACYFVGIYLCLIGEVENNTLSKDLNKYWITLLVFTLCTFILSLSVFGIEDTTSYLMQKRQQAVGYQEGGSWNLHLPSTALMFFLIPFYIYAVLKFYKIKSKANLSGKKYIMFAICIYLIFSFLLNIDDLNKLLNIWTEPRYQAHSIRELLTFPLTYLPLPLFFFLNWDRPKKLEINENFNKKLNGLLLCCLMLFCIAFSYQIYISLNSDIGKIAQKPAFAKNQELTISYLLSSHYFEHFLDTIYFTLLSLVIYKLIRTKSNYKIDHQSSL